MTCAWPSGAFEQASRSSERMASASCFVDALPPRSRWLRKELQWLASSLGAVRDLDVQVEQLHGWTDDPDHGSAGAIEPMQRILERNRRAARTTLIRHLDSKRYERIVAVGTELLRRGPLSHSPGARVPIVASAPALIAKPYRRVRRAGDGLDASWQPSDLHVLRIKCKMVTATNPTTNDSRAPKTVRLKMSRPPKSVPK